MGEMIDRVALGLLNRFRKRNNLGPAPSGDVMSPEHWAEWREDAIAAIEAMREPTDAILQAGFDDPAVGVIWGAAITNEDRVNMWQAMIDQALKEG